MVAEHVERKAEPRFGGAGRGGRERGRVAGKEANGTEDLLARAIGDEADESAERNRDEAESERDTPFTASDASDGEGRATNEDNQELSADFCMANEYTVGRRTGMYAYR